MTTVYPLPAGLKRRGRPVPLDDEQTKVARTIYRFGRLRGYTVRFCRTIAVRAAQIPPRAEEANEDTTERTGKP